MRIEALKDIKMVSECAVNVIGIIITAVMGIINVTIVTFISITAIVITITGAIKGM